MAIKRYDGNKNKQDGTSVIRLLDSSGVLREIKKNDTIDLSPAQITALGQSFVLSDTTDPVTAPVVKNPVYTTDILGSDGKIITALLPGDGGLPSGGATGQALTKRSNADGDTQWTTVSAAANALGRLVFRGAWQASTSYAAGDVVIDPSATTPQLVVTPNSHTSGASFAYGSMVTTGRWVKLGTHHGYFGAFTTGQYYPAGSLYLDAAAGNLVEAAIDHTAGASYDSAKTKTPRLFESLVTASTLVAPENYSPAFHTPLPAPAIAPSFARVRQANPVKRFLSLPTATGVSSNNGNCVVSEDTADFLYGDRSVVLTQSPTVASFITFPSFTALDMSATGAFLRFPFQISTIANIVGGSGNMTIRLYSGAASGSNYHEATITKNNETWLDGGEWKTCTIAISDFAVVGTGATLSAISNIAILQRATTGNFVTKWQWFDLCQSQVAKAKVVLWFDDSMIEEAIRQLAPYGFPGVAAIAVGDLETGGNTQKVARMRQLTDVLGWQVASHSYFMAEHGSVHGDALTAQFAKIHAWNRAYGNPGSIDYAYWGNGPVAKGDDRIRIRSAFRSGRWNQSGPRLIETMAPAMPELTRAWLTASGETSATNWQPWVTQAINARGLAQFVWHPGNLVSGSANATQFGTFLAWLATQAVDVVTIDEAWRSIAATA